jgi:hypothetical protein
MLCLLVAYGYHAIDEFQKVQQKLADDYVAAVKALQEVDREFPDKSAGTIKTTRYDDWLAVRSAAAEVFADRYDPETASNFSMRRTRIMMLERVAIVLRARKLGLKEYCAVAARWRSIVALPEFGKMQDEWRKAVRVQTDPEPMPLAATAKDARTDEIAWVRLHAPALTASMQVDVFDVLLAKIANDPPLK